MDNKELNKIRELRNNFDCALSPCDPLDYQMRQRDLLYAIAEYLVAPLQEYELAERSKLPPESKDEDNEAEPT